MTRSAPYQPFLLRILHGGSGILAIGAIISGFLVYNTFDGRFGKIPLTKIDPIQDIHGTLGLFFLISLPVFALYSLYAGQKRLLQPDSLQKLTQVGKPIWWVSWQRLANTFMLFASVLAVISGRMMKEEWLPLGELNHIWYSVHLIAWVVMICSLAIHILLSAKLGGGMLLLSIVNWRFRPEDSPTRWYGRLSMWINNFKANWHVEINQWIQRTWYLKIIEILVLGGIFIAFILPLFFSGDES
ncbi:MAG TPA: cytochrome b/b6 domain-containing protein [Nostocaceae cyanobacterium]|nr:cytochrome b/b6 domain-containing protein [Nostocaceae cyanobacterium]